MAPSWCSAMPRQGRSQKPEEFIAGTCEQSAACEFATGRRTRRRGGRRHARSHRGAPADIGQQGASDGAEACSPSPDLGPSTTSSMAKGYTNVGCDGMAAVSAGMDILVTDLATYCAEDLVGNPELCNDFASFLETGSCDKRQVVEWLCGHEGRLSLAGQCSCRVVQKLLEILGGSLRDQIVARLVPSILDLLDSPHGNHVLTKIIEVVPRPGLGAIIAQLHLRGYRAVARHRFGCRVLERLVEHGTEEQMCRVMDECVLHSEELSRHQYGNFVIQSLLEHGSPIRRQMVLQRLLPFLPQLAIHRTASHVVQQALSHGSTEGQHAIAAALLCAEPPHSFADVAASRYGSYVVEELHDVFGTDGPGMQAHCHLQRALAVFDKSPSFVRVAVKFGLLEEEASGLPAVASGHVDSESSDAAALQD